VIDYRQQTKQSLLKEISRLQRTIADLEKKLQNKSATLNNNNINKLYLKQKHLSDFASFAIESLSDGAFLISKDASIVYVNRAACKQLGYTEEELLSMRVMDFHPHLTPERWYSVWGVTVKDKIQTIEVEHLTKDGRIVPFEVLANYIEINGEQYSCSFTRDITERKKAEESLRQSEERQKTILDSIHAGILLIDEETHVITDINPVAAHMLGSTREQIIGSICNKHVCPAEVGKCPITDLGQKIDNSDRILITANGKQLSILKTVAPVTIHGRRHLLETFIDITDRKQAEKEHLLNETRLSSLLELSRMTDQTDQVITDFTLEKAIALTGSAIGYLAFMNEDETVLTMYSWSRQAMKECLVETKPLVYPVETTGLWGEAVRHRQPIITNDYAAPNPIKKGYPKGHVQVRRHMNIPLFDRERIVLVAGVGNKEEPYGKSDIQQLTLLMDGMWKIIKQKRAEEELRKSEEAIYESYSTQSLINILLSESLKPDPSELILQKALNMVLSIPWLPFQVHGRIFLVEDQPDILVMKVKSGMNETPCSQIPFGKCICGRAALSQEIVISHHTDERHECCNGGLTSHGDYAVPILYRGNTLGVIHINVSEEHEINQHMVEFLATIANTLAGIIERKKVEQDRAKLQSQLLQAQKMEAIGTLAGGVAHDFNNLLMGILGYTSLMLTKTDKSHPFYENLKIIEQQVESGAELTKQLLGFARSGKYEVKPFHVNDLIIKTSDIFGRTKKEITIYKELQENLHTIEGDSRQIEQVLFNLYVNAWQAMPSGGRLYIETQNAILDEKQCRAYDAKPGPHVKLLVTDTGVGMDAETQKRIFEPFFTTKGVGKGTGLGLASAYGIIKNHGGIINVYSEKGHGTTLTIYLPATAKKADETKPAEEGLLTGEETILVVDDEKVNVELMKELLERLGYKIFTAQSGKKAIEMYRKHAGKIQLVILDMIMPEMHGKETLVKLMEIDKNVCVLLSSGYSINGEAKTILELGCKGFIQKPFRPEELARKIRDVLDTG